MVVATFQLNLLLLVALTVIMAQPSYISLAPLGPPNPDVCSLSDPEHVISLQELGRHGSDGEGGSVWMAIKGEACLENEGVNMS